MAHDGSCHCGAIAFDLDADVTDAIDCNCSLCRKRGGLLAFFPREALTLQTPESALSTYTFNHHALQHHFCTRCGIAPYSEGAHPETGAKMVAVNVRCLPDVDLSTLQVSTIDGASM